MKPKIFLIRPQPDSTKIKVKIWADHLREEDVALKKYFDSINYQYYSSESFPSVFIYCIKILRESKKIRSDVIVAYGCNRVTWLLSILKNIIAPKVKLVILEFATITPLSILKEILYKFAYSQCDLIGVCSKSEILLYEKNIGIKGSQIIHLAAPIEKNYFTHSNIPASPSDEPYILSAGKGYRDYSTLSKAAELTTTKTPIYIIADSESLINIENSPNNIKVVGTVDRDTYFKYLVNSQLVIVPLQNIERAAGQQVIYQAISTGKIVIGSNIPCTKELQIDYPNSIYLFECGNAEELANLIDKLIKESFSKKTPEANKLTEEELWGIEAFCKRLRDAVDQISVSNN